MTFLDKISPYAKAIAGFIVPALPTVTAALQDGSPGGSSITVAEWVGILAASGITSAVVWAVPNKDPHATHQDESVQPPAPPAGDHLQEPGVPQ